MLNLFVLQAGYLHEQDSSKAARAHVRLFALRAGYPLGPEAASARGFWGRRLTRLP